MFSYHNIKKIPPTHLLYLTDDFGIWQHTKGPLINREKGYALDDSARALLAALELKLEDKAKVYAQFLKTAVSSNKIVNFFGPDRKPLSLPWSEDALGQTYWALSEYQARLDLPENSKILEAIKTKIKSFSSVRGKSYALLGAVTQDHKLGKNLANDLIAEFERLRRRNWTWLERSLTYGNAIIPFALLSYGEKFHDEKSLGAGILMLDFLNRITKVEDVPIVIGNEKWFGLGAKKCLFDQQPVDAAYQVLANLKAYEITNDEIYLEEAREYFYWFWGKNLLEKSLIDPKRGTCADGLWPDAISPNSGAESIICFLWAQEKIWPYLR